MTGPSRITPSGIWSTWKLKAPSAAELAAGPKTRCFGALGVLPSSSGGMPGRMSSVDLPLAVIVGGPRTFSAQPADTGVGIDDEPADRGAGQVPRDRALVEHEVGLLRRALDAHLGRGELERERLLAPLRFHSSFASEAASVSTSRPLTRKCPLVVQTVVLTPALSVVTPWKQPAPPATSAPWVMITARSILIVGLSTHGASLTVTANFAVAVAPSSSVTRTPTDAGPFWRNVVVASGERRQAVSYVPLPSKSKS